MLYFLDDIIQEIIARQPPKLFFSKEISDHENRSQIAARLCFNALSRCGTPANTAASPKHTEEGAPAEEKGKENVWASI